MDISISLLASRYRAETWFFSFSFFFLIRFHSIDRKDMSHIHRYNLHVLRVSVANTTKELERSVYKCERRKQNAQKDKERKVHFPDRFEFFFYFVTMHMDILIFHILRRGS